MWPLFAGLWVFLIVVIVLTIYVDILRAMLVHGKIRQSAQLPSGVLGAILRLEMKKSGWIYFYFIGAVHNLAIALALLTAPHHRAIQQSLVWLQSGTTTIETPIGIRLDAIAVIALLGIQDARRFLESVFVTEFGDAKMHVALFGVAIVHYVAIAPSILSAPHSRWDGLADKGSLVHPAQLVAALVVFVFGSHQQHVLNSRLALQKRLSGGKHDIPRGGWFDYVLCPLYSAEILIYLAFALACGMANPMVNLVFVWVVINQTICAHYGKQWYCSKFRGETLPKWAIVPGVF